MTVILESLKPKSFLRLIFTEGAAAATDVSKVAAWLSVWTAPGAAVGLVTDVAARVAAGVAIGAAVGAAMVPHLIRWNTL